MRFKATRKWPVTSTHYDSLVLKHLALLLLHRRIRGFGKENDKLKINRNVEVDMKVTNLLIRGPASGSTLIVKNTKILKFVKCSRKH